jgi:hypothetical protein
MCLVTVTAGAQNTSTSFRVMRDSWSDADERGFIEFIEAIGNSRCGSIDRCMRSAANPFAKTDPPGLYFAADCADLPYFLRGYYA